MDCRVKTWGELREQRSEWQREGLENPIRFQGQYHDHETGLHYNRYRFQATHLRCFRVITRSHGAVLLRRLESHNQWSNPWRAAGHAVLSADR